MTKIIEIYELGFKTKKGFAVCYSFEHMDLPAMLKIIEEKRRNYGDMWKIRKTVKTIKTKRSYIN